MEIDTILANKNPLFPIPIQRFLKQYKADGNDGIPVELIKVLTCFSTKLFHLILKKIWNEGSQKIGTIGKLLTYLKTNISLIVNTVKS